MSELFIKEHPELVGETYNSSIFTAQNHNNRFGIKDKLQNNQEIELNS